MKDILEINGFVANGSEWFLFADVKDAVGVDNSFLDTISKDDVRFLGQNCNVITISETALYAAVLSKYSNKLNVINEIAQKTKEYRLSKINN